MGESGILLVDKPQGVTSHDVVGAVRGALHTRHVGHAGTLDPMATGLLVVGFGKSTRLLRYMVGHTKEYLATIRLGLATDSDDADGNLIRTDHAKQNHIESVLKSITQEGLQALVNEFFVGAIDQIPSAFSSVRVHGKHSYELARNGEIPELKPRAITVFSFEILDVEHHEAQIPCNWRNEANEGSESTQNNEAEESAQSNATSSVTSAGGERTIAVPVVDVKVRVSCSSGTYIRALARDLGARLGTGGHLIALRRTRVGDFCIDSHEASNTAKPCGSAEGESNERQECTTPAEDIAKVKVEQRERRDRKTGAVEIRNRAVMTDSAETLLKYALSPAAAASRIMDSIEISAKEAVDLGYGRDIDRRINTTSAAIYTAQDSKEAEALHTDEPQNTPRLCAILVPDSHGMAKPQTVFPVNVKA
ncbi:tRNA pseudouridine(55) synthase TruB [Bifidobacterium aquikefiricola]|uniref:tRNA pseudouridine synthase B n=1 Tax=Bifidobacterium aquikefiricola TaxID=3059038 RepID=A0AB39U7T2_9BIFI